MTPTARLALASVLPVLLLTGCGGGPARAPADPLLDAIRAEEREGHLSYDESQGRRLFVQYCSTCHGDEGKGDGQNASNLTPPPPDMTMANSSRDVAYIRQVIAEGSAAVRRSPLSPPWGRSLSAQQINDLVAYCQTLNQKAR